MLLVAAVLGALLGGAVAHWRRGSGMIVTGAIIGAIALPLICLAALFYTVIAGGIILLALAVMVVGSVLG
ncbi:GlsB/YeaQ/YmgE family stress response membrane protein [Bosea caraganae]|uniref:GlsB/YeaQ/YmgE family stress response membrane protein n=1 Tax=Bosea caraganae TaxID=2763117 RepID=UPI0015F0CC40|nr:GlsB/YeaQ/YmgE family stress response membrane protein [Bosea caraganae]